MAEYPCWCGAKNCRGTLLSPKDREDTPKIPSQKKAKGKAKDKSKADAKPKVKAEAKKKSKADAKAASKDKKSGDKAKKSGKKTLKGWALYGQAAVGAQLVGRWPAHHPRRMRAAALNTKT